MIKTILFFLKNYWVYFFVAGLVMVGVSWIYSAGQANGRVEVRALWDAEKIRDMKVIDALQAQIKVNEDLHRKENQRITDELAKANMAHAVALATVRTDYTVRLRLSETRADSYKRLSEGGSSQRDYLADHASKLDRTLEEGRSLVRELRETLGQRDTEVKALSERIKNDQRLFQ